MQNAYYGFLDNSEAIEIYRKLAHGYAVAAISKGGVDRLKLGRKAVRSALRACHYAMDRSACGHAIGNLWCDPNLPKDAPISADCRAFYDANIAKLGVTLAAKVRTTRLYCSGDPFVSTLACVGDLIARDYLNLDAVGYAAAERLIRHYATGITLTEPKPIGSPPSTATPSRCVAGCPDGECLAGQAHNPTTTEEAQIADFCKNLINTELCSAFPPDSCPPRGSSSSSSAAPSPEPSASAECAPRKVEVVYIRPSDRVYDRKALGELESNARLLQIWLKERLGDGSTYTWGVRTVISDKDTTWFTGVGPRPPRITTAFNEYFWKQARQEGLSLVGGSESDPSTLWVFYVDADPTCEQAQFAERADTIEGSNVLVLGGADLRSVSDASPRPGYCGDTIPGSGRCSPAGRFAERVLQAWGVNKLDGPLSLDPIYPGGTLSDEVKAAIFASGYVDASYGAEVPVGETSATLNCTTNDVLKRSTVSLQHVTTGDVFVSYAPGELTTAYTVVPGISSKVFTDVIHPATLPLNFEGLEVLVEGRRAPLMYAGPSQINFAIPYETPVISFGGDLELRLHNRRLSNPFPSGTPLGSRGLLHGGDNSAIGWACSCSSCGPLPGTKIASYALLYGSGMSKLDPSKTSIIVDNGLASFPTSSPADPLVGTEYPNHPTCLGRPGYTCPNDFEATGYGVDVVKWTPPPYILKQKANDKLHGVALALDVRDFRGNAVNVKFDYCGASCPVNSMKRGGTCTVNPAKTCGASVTSNRNSACSTYCGYATDFCDCEVTDDCRPVDP